MGFPVSMIDRVLSKRIREGWPVQKRNWGGECGFFHLLFPKSYLSQTQEFLGWGFSTCTSGEKLTGLSLGVSQKPKRCEWRQGL